MTGPLVVLDLEWTAWEGSTQRGWSGPGELREIVQAGAVRLNAGFREQAALEILIRPRSNPLLSEYFTTLTGITQARVDAEGVDVAQGLADLQSFIGDAAIVCSNGRDREVVEENCRLFGLPSLSFARWLDVRPLLCETSGDPTQVSGAVAQLFGLEPAGSAHHALSDARNVAAVLGLLYRRGLFLPYQAV